MSREKVSIRDIVRAKADGLPIEKQIEVGRDFVDYRPQLYKSLSMPSYVHSYSIAVEYMTKWFLKQFEPNTLSDDQRIKILQTEDQKRYHTSIFKTVFINGKHIMDDWKHFNNQNVVREKPMVAILPVVNYDYDRENEELYLANKDVFLRRSQFQQAFLKDYERMLFLYMQVKIIEMEFTYRLRFNTRAQQLDFFHKMEMLFRINASQSEYLSADWHIPYDIILNIAEGAHFEIDKKTNMIKNIPGFINYMNRHSSIPVIFKMRAINQKPEFFIRVKNIHAHIFTRDKLQLDDGERSGKLDTNFMIEMRVQLHMPVPHFFAYMSQNPIAHTIPVIERKGNIPIYSINYFEIPPENELGWKSICVTGYQCDKGDTEIDISELFASNEWAAARVLRRNLELGITPEAFLDVKLYHNDDLPKWIRFHMDYRNMKIILDEEVKGERIEIAIYADMKYLNDTITSINSYDKSRVALDPDSEDNVLETLKKN